MGRYSPQELEELSNRLGRRLGARRLKNGIWAPDWSLHEQLGLDVPELEQDKDAFIQTITRYGSTPARSASRVSQIWTPYMNAELARATDEKNSLEKLPYVPSFPDDSPVFTILGGTSATGKSTLRRSVWDYWTPTGNASGAAYTLAVDGSPFRPGSVIVDPDNAKMMLPEYQGHLLHQLPGGSSYVHEESRNLAEALRQRAVSANMSVVYDTSGQFNGTYGSGQSGSSMLAELKQKGYYIPAVYFFSNIQATTVRAKERERLTGRSVPSGIIPVMQNNLTTIVPGLWNANNIDELVLIEASDIDDLQIMMWLKRDPSGAVRVVRPGDENFATYFGRNPGLFRT